MSYLLNFIAIPKELSFMVEYVIEHGLNILVSLLILFIGWMVIKGIVRFIERILDDKQIDATLKPLIVSTASLLMKIMLLLAVASTMGIKTTSFIAVLGGLSIAAGLALQGSLANLAGGILLLIFRPLKVGEYIKAQGVEGFVKEVQLLVTIVETADKQTVFLPNGALANSTITNVSRQGTIRLHIPVGVGYEADIKQARDVLVNAMQETPLVLKNPAPTVAVVNLGDSSVDLDLRPWCNAGDVPAVTVTVLENAKLALDAANINIPYPHQVLVKV